MPGEIRIIAPPRSLYTFGPIVVHDMVRRMELCRCAQGEMLSIPAQGPIEVGIAWGRGHTPSVKLRFMAWPGGVYRLFWLTDGFGAGMEVDADQVLRDLLHL